jgi:hypothetical protein
MAPTIDGRARTTSATSGAVVATWVVGRSSNGRAASE